MTITEIEKQIASAESPDEVNNIMDTLDAEPLTDKQIRIIAVIAADKLIELTKDK